MKTLFVSAFIGIFANSAFAFSMSEYLGVNSLKAPDRPPIVASLGLANQNNGLSINTEVDLRTTNNNMYLLGLQYGDRINLKASLPFKDPVESRISRVDSDIQSYSLSYSLSEDLKANLIYSKTKGYFMEDPKDGSVLVLMPNLSFNHYGVNLYKLSNKDHQSTFLNPLITQKMQDSGSWIYALGYSHSEVSGLEEIDYLPKAFTLLADTDAKSVRIDTITARIAYSYNWFWERWYTTGAIGFGQNMDYVQKNYSSSQKSDFAGNQNVLFSFAGGYIWNQSTLGFFATQSTLQYRIDGMNITSRIGNSGLYYSRVF